jgi:hypothetical protein
MSRSRTTQIAAFIDYLVTGKYAQRWCFLEGKDTLVFNGDELMFRWHSECDYLLCEEDEGRRMRYLYRVFYEHFKLSGVVFPDPPYERNGPVEHLLPIGILEEYIAK